MKKAILFSLLTVLTVSINTFADTKVKSRMTSSGQTYESTTYIKGKRSRAEQNIGEMQTVTLTQCDLKRGVQLNPQTQVYIINSWENDSTAPTQVSVSGNTKTEIKKGGVVTTTITTKDTGETKKMFGYTARHLIITSETEASPDACTPMKKMKMVTDGWYIDAAFALDCDYNTRNPYAGNAPTGGCQDRYDLKQLGSTTKRGYPVLEKTTMYDEAGAESFTSTNEVLELSSATLDQSLFEIPKDYREVKDSAAMYASMSSSNSNSVNSTGAFNRNSSPSNSSSINSTISKMNMPKSENNYSSTLEAKKPDTVRIGLANVKTGAVGEGLNAAELATAIQNALPQYLKGTKVEVVQLDAKLQAAIDAEAEEKDCDYILNMTVSHKKGGGGFGMFGKALGTVVAQTGGGAWGNTAANVAGAVAVNTIAAATLSQNVKSKDEITLDVKLNKGGAQTLAKQFKAKAKGDGDDIISQVVEQAANALVEAAK